MRNEGPIVLMMLAPKKCSEPSVALREAPKAHQKSPYVRPSYFDSFSRAFDHPGPNYFPIVLMMLLYEARAPRTGTSAAQ